MHTGTGEWHLRLQCVFNVVPVFLQKYNVPLLLKLSLSLSLSLSLIREVLC